MALPPIQIIIQAAVAASVQGAAGQASAALGGVGAAASQATQQAAALSGKLETLRNVGVGIAAIGVGGLALTQSFIEAHKEGDGLEKKLESILNTQGRLKDLDAINKSIGDVTSEGHFDDDDSIRDAAIHMASFGVETEQIAQLLPRVARQVRTGFGDMTSVADGMGKAYANIDVGPLSRSGLVFSEAEKEAVKYAKSLGEVEGRAKFVEVVMAAVDRNTVALGDSLTAAEMAANDLANAWDGATTTMGAGAGEAQAHVNGVLASILNVVNQAPALEYAAGYLGYFGSGAAVAVGGLLSVGSQIGMTVLSLQAMGITSVASFGAMAKASWLSFTTMAKGALVAAPAIWAAMAPLIPLILAIAAAALVTVGALYLLSGAYAAQNQAEADAEQAGQADKDFYEQQVGRRAAGKTSRVNVGETFEQWQKRMGRGDENSEDSGGDDASKLLDLQKQVGAIPGNMTAPTTGAAMPQMPAQLPPVTMPVIPVMTAPVMMAGVPLVSAGATMPRLARGAIGARAAPIGASGSDTGDMTDTIKIARAAMFGVGGARGGAPDLGGDDGPTRLRAQGTASQNARGDFVVTFDDLVIPSRGIGDLRGRSGGRR